jgi:RHS repeat-associated protein
MRVPVTGMCSGLLPLSILTGSWRRGADDSVLASYVYGAYIDDVVTMRRAVPQGGIPADWFFHSDDQFSVSAVTNAAGALAERVAYGDFGAPVFLSPGGVASVASAIGNPYAFTGRRWDAAERTYHYRFRTFSPGLGRFTTRDPIGIWGDALNLGNGYTYTGNDPWSWVDPWGLVPNQVDTTNLCEILRMTREANSPLLDIEDYSDYDQVFGRSDGSVARYLYTEKYGWIDLLHFFRLAGIADKYHSDIFSRFAGFGNEVLQWLQNDSSGFSYEDMPSNKAGAVFGDNIVDEDPEENITLHLYMFLSDAGALGCSEDPPGFSKMPVDATAVPDHHHNPRDWPLYVSAQGLFLPNGVYFVDSAAASYDSTGTSVQPACGGSTQEASGADSK